MAERRRPGLGIVVGVLLGVMLLVALLLTPAADDSRGRLISSSAAPGGARALHDLQLRSGWQVERMDVPYPDSMDTRAVYAVLDPLLGLTSSEVHRLLEAVRGGAGLLVVIPEGGPLADSLGIRRSSTGAPMVHADEAPSGFCADSLNRPGLINWPGGRVQSYWLNTALRPAAIFTRVEAEARRPRRGGSAVIASDTVRLERAPRAIVDTARLRRIVDSLERASVGPGTGDSTIVRTRRDSPGASPVRGTGGVQVRTRVESSTVALPRLAMAGYTLGRGRVVAVADADLLRNDVLRVCRWNAGPSVARALDWLAVTAGERLVFDEFHQDPAGGAHPVRAVRRALVWQPWGRMVLAATLGGLVLLAAAGMRPMSPEPLTTVQRRSPLEHVRALARAYESAGSTRLVARRLVRGLRRRHALTSLAGGEDNAFLTALVERHPTLAADVDLLRRAMAEPVTAEQLPSLGDAVARIDSRLRPNI